MTDTTITWRDITSYSQSERGKVEPRTWSCKVESLEITITRRIGCPGTWFVVCRPLINLEDLNEDNLETAKQKAFQVVHQALDRQTKNALAALRVLNAHLETLSENESPSFI